MKREEAIRLAQLYAKQYKPSYYEEPFEPHEWVIQAVIGAFVRGSCEGVLAVLEHFRETTK